MDTNITILFSEPFLDDFEKKIVFYEGLTWSSDTKQKLIESINKVMQCLGAELDFVKVAISVSSKQNDTIIKKLNTFLKGGNISVNTRLSLREIEVLDQILKGSTNKQIAEALFICIDTVKTHRKKILSKTGMPNTPALINHYHRTLFDDH